MSEILGVDLGTHSIGLTVRDEGLSRSLEEQLIFYSSVIFPAGVGSDNTGEYSYAAERTKHRSSRRLYMARKYRKWNTLEVLIEHGYCPLKMDDLKKWSTYDKEKGYTRKYPVESLDFEQWIRLDFNGDGISDYSSPYQLRDELATTQFDFSIQINRYKLGRALYHIAQRRGFKSSKGDTIKGQEKINGETFDEITSEMKKSEEEKSKDITSYMNKNNLKTVGCAYAQLEREGKRIRGGEYQAVRSQYRDEIEVIFDFQKDLDDQKDFRRKILSERKSEGTIFYKRPLRSQKGLVGPCTLEKNKQRCPISHPAFEEFRAWSFINNILYRKQDSDDWQTISLELKVELFKDRFLLTRASFKFSDIRKWLEKKIQYQLSYYKKTINYKDNANVSGCPIMGRLKSLLGENWKSDVIWNKRLNSKTGERYSVSYNYEDIWHICFSYEDVEYVEEFGKKHLKLDDNKTAELTRIWGAISQGYGMLSLKAVSNITYFLKKGFIYSDSVLLAKLPDLLGKEEWGKNKDSLLKDFDAITKMNQSERKLLGITNNLISRYKINDEYIFAYKDVKYVLQHSDFEDVEKAISESYGSKTWKNKSEKAKQEITNKVAKHYQDFFKSSKRDYFRIPKIGDSLKIYLSNNFLSFNCLENSVYSYDSNLPCECNACKKLDKLYHHSQIQIYKSSTSEKIQRGNGVFSVRLLPSPVTGAIKNPMAMRVLHTLRKQINNLIVDGVIDEDTKVVVEVARDLNDANKRWAISTYQNERQKENKEFEIAIAELIKDSDFIGKADPKNKDDIDKVRLWIELFDNGMNNELFPKYYESYKKSNLNSEVLAEIVKCKNNDYLKKYRLWKEQEFRCVYTNKIIKLSDLFEDNKIELEHTIPRSISFDNSLANLTVCHSYFNREVKKNKIPSQLNNYDDILERIQPWIDKIENLKDNIEYWRGQSKFAQDKTQKDKCIRQRHLWQMELNYWQNKVERFTMLEVNSGFRNSQLVDTRLISKYAFHYLKSVFNRVDVQKGSVTSDFRKMLGVQSIYDNKDRNKHSHHAIDAAILTLIPSSAKRDKMLKLFYEIEEAESLWQDITLIKSDLEKEINSCNFGPVSGISEFIENNIIVNHLSKDQTLTPAIKKHRIRGKIVPLKDETGKVILEERNNGKFAPKAKFIKTGNSIRGKLHDETFYGAITQAKKDDKGSFIRDKNGEIISNKEILYVIRRELKYKTNPQDAGFKTWDDLEKVIVDKALFSIMKNQFSSEINFKDACEKGVYMIDKKGNRVNKIRRVRCKANIKNPITVKTQTYLSKKEYKRNYYAKNGENIYYSFYWDGVIKSNKTYDYRSLMDLSNMQINTIGTEIESYFEPFKWVGRGKNSMEAPIYEVLKNGSRLLVFKENELSNKSQTLSVDDYKELLSQTDSKDLNKRLYIFKRLFPDDGRVQLKYHLESRDDKQLLADFANDGKKGSNGFSEINIINPYPKLLLSPKNLFFLREYKDFIIESGEIKIL